MINPDMSNMKEFLKQFIPPILLKRPQKYGFFGQYRSFQEVGELPNPGLLEKLIERPLSVTKQWQLVAWILHIKPKSVIDFGGALGDVYRQNQEMFQGIKWQVVEKPDYVKAGQRFTSENLSFHESITDCAPAEVLLMSGSLQYLDHPYQFLASLPKFDWILFDRLFVAEKEMIVFQKSPPKSFLAQYLVWFLNQDKLLRALPEYKLIMEFPSYHQQSHRKEMQLKGLILKKI